MRHIAQDMRGIPLWLLREDLEELGGAAESAAENTAEAVVRGAGWQVRLTRLEPLRLGSLAIGQVRVELEIEDALADDFVARFAKKTMRAGG